MAGSTPSPPPGPTSVPPSAPASGLSGTAKAGIGVAVVAIVVVAALALGVVPGVHLYPTTSTGSSTGSSSASAIGPANQTAASHAPGHLVAVVGASTTYPFSFGKIPSSITTCAVTGGLTTNLTVPAQSGSYSDGEASVWVFAYVNLSTPSETLVAVVGTVAYFLGQLTGASCVNTTVPALAGPYESSTAAAGQIDPSAGAFLLAHPSANALYFLLQNSTSGHADWGVVFTNCSYDPSTNATAGGPRGDLFEGVLDAVSGAVLESVTELGSAECSAPTSHGPSPIALAPSVVATGGSGTTWYVSVGLDPSSSVTTTEFGLKVTNASTDVLALAAAVAGSGCTVGATFSVGSSGCAGAHGGSWYAVLVNATGAIVATFTSVGWSGSVLVAGGGFTLEVLSPFQLDGEGYALSAYAYGSQPVSGAVTL